MVILEGPDNAGKTTLAKTLMQRHDWLKLETWDGIPREELKNTAKERTYQALAREVRSRGVPRLYDRLFFSELVYGEILRPDGTMFPWPESRYICRVLTAISPPIIFCLPPKEVVFSNMEGQMNGVPQNIDRIYTMYSALTKVARPRITVYDWTRGPAAVDRVSGVVEKYLNRRAARQWQ